MAVGTAVSAPSSVLRLSHCDRTYELHYSRGAMCCPGDVVPPFDGRTGDRDDEKRWVDACGSVATACQESVPSHELRILRRAVHGAVDSRCRHPGRRPRTFPGHTPGGPETAHPGNEMGPTPPARSRRRTYPPTDHLGCGSVEVLDFGQRQRLARTHVLYADVTGVHSDRQRYGTSDRCPLPGAVGPRRRCRNGAAQTS